MTARIYSVPHCVGFCRYATSEVRLAEITEQLCKDVGRGETQCHQLAGEWEEGLEEWWQLDPATRPHLRQWLCVDRVKVCCPPDHFGPHCQVQQTEPSH